MLVFRAADQDACDEWAMHFQNKIMEIKSADFAGCSIGDDDTRFWAETVKVVPLSLSIPPSSLSVE